MERGTTSHLVNQQRQALATNYFKCYDNLSLGRIGPSGHVGPGTAPRRPFYQRNRGKGGGFRNRFYSLTNCTYHKFYCYDARECKDVPQSTE